MYPRIAMVSTFPPTQCGIATFADSLTQALTQAGATVEAVDLPTESGSPPHDSILHRHSGAQDITVTAHLLNSFDVVILQHEFGIWDGVDGSGIVDLMGAIAVPVITVLHTIPSAARGGQRRALQQLLDLSDAIVVLSHSAFRRLRQEFAVRPGSLWTIPHGATQRWQLRQPDRQAANGRIMTWGLIGKGKGLEWGIQALALLHERGLRCEYVIAGATHPNIKRAEGEAYRDSLRALAASLDLSQHVVFADGYLSDAGLGDLISNSSVFLLPYDSREQITSGVLVEAVAAGGPVVGTRFPHAVELLGTGAGILVNHSDPVCMADAMEITLTDGDARHRMRTQSRALATQLDWGSVGSAYLELADQLWRGSSSAAPSPLVGTEVCA